MLSRVSSSRVSSSLPSEPIRSRKCSSQEGDTWKEDASSSRESSSFGLHSVPLVDCSSLVEEDAEEELSLPNGTNILQIIVLKKT